MVVRAFCLRRVALLATNSGYLPKASGGAAVGDDGGINGATREIDTGPRTVRNELWALELRLELASVATTDTDNEVRPRCLGHVDRGYGGSRGAPQKETGIVGPRLGTPG